MGITSEDVIPFVDLGLQHVPLREAILEITKSVLTRGDFVLGGAVAQFEREFAEYCETSFCVGVGNGTDALTLVLRALGVEGPEHEVILPALTFVATAEAVVNARGRVALADVRPDTFTLDPASVERALTPRTRAIIAVHLYGLPADMEALREIARERRIHLIEDAAQAHGARYKGARVGGLGDAATFSFYPSKNLGACGDAGAVVTRDADISARIRMLRDHGSRKKYEHLCVGFNSRLDTIQAAILSLKLRLLDGWNGLRRAHAARYRHALEGVDGFELPECSADREHVMHLMVVKVREALRDRVSTSLSEAGIGWGIHYPSPIHRTEAFKFLGYSLGDFPVAEEASRRVLSLPMYAELTDAQVDRVCRVISTSCSEARF